MKLRLALFCVLALVLLPVGQTRASFANQTASPVESAGQSARLGLAASDHEHTSNAAPEMPSQRNQARADKDKGAPAVDDFCGGTSLRKLEKSNRCTHGPDPAPPGLDVKKSVAPLKSAAAASPQAQCVGDGTSGPRVQVLYARASDVASRYTAFLPSFHAWVDDANRIFQESAAETGGARAIRFVHNASCVVSIPEVVLSTTGDDTFDNTVNQLSTLGLNRTDRKYMIFMDANVLCGIGHIWGNDTPGAGNPNNGGRLYGRTDAGCWGSEVPAHELMHNLGGVQNTAPHASGGWHCVDEWDRMCYRDEPNFPTMQFVCGNSASPAHDRLFDCNHDDYFHTNPPAGNWLATHWNAANNIYLDGATAAPPPCPDAGRELDNSAAQAGAFAVSGAQQRAFCTTDDVDWVSFQATAGTQYRIETRNLAASVDTVLDLYGSDGSTLIASNDDGNGGLASLIDHTASAAGRRYLRVSDFGGTPGSPGFGFELRITATADASPPTTPALTVVEAPNTPNQHVRNGTVYYRAVAGGQPGAFRVTATTGDPESGIQAVRFPVVFGSDGLNDPTSPYERVYSWTAGGTVAGAESVVAVNTAGVVSQAATFTVRPDAGKPVVTLVAPTAGATVGGTVAIRATATDAGAGVQRVVFRRCRNGTCVDIGTDTTPNASGQYTIPWNTAGLANGPYTVQAQAYDLVNNTAIKAAGVTVRNGASARAAASDTPAAAPKKATANQARGTKRAARPQDDRE